MTIPPPPAGFVPEATDTPDPMKVPAPAPPAGFIPEPAAPAPSRVKLAPPPPPAGFVPEPDQVGVAAAEPEPQAFDPIGHVTGAVLEAQRQRHAGVADFAKQYPGDKEADRLARETEPSAYDVYDAGVFPDLPQIKQRQLQAVGGGDRAAAEAYAQNLRAGASGADPAFDVLDLGEGKVAVRRREWRRRMAEKAKAGNYTNTPGAFRPGLGDRFAAGTTNELAKIPENVAGDLAAPTVDEYGRTIPGTVGIVAPPGSPDFERQQAQVKQNVHAAADKAIGGFVELPAAATLPERLTDMGAGLTASLIQLAIARRIVTPAMAAANPLAAEAAAWELVNRMGGGTPGVGALQGAFLHGVGKLPLPAGAGGEATRALVEGTGFGGLAAAQGGDAFDVLGQAALPVALRAPGLAKAAVNGMRGEGGAAVERPAPPPPTGFVPEQPGAAAKQEAGNGDARDPAQARDVAGRGGQPAAGGDARGGVAVPGDVRSVDDRVAPVVGPAGSSAGAVAGNVGDGRQTAPVGDRGRGVAGAESSANIPDRIPGPEPVQGPVERPGDVPQAVKTPEELRRLSGHGIREQARLWGVAYDSPSLTLPRIMDAQERWRVEQMSDKELWDETRARGLRAGTRQQNVESILSSQRARPEAPAAGGNTPSSSSSPPAEAPKTMAAPTGEVKNGGGEVPPSSPSSPTDQPRGKPVENRSTEQPQPEPVKPVADAGNRAQQDAGQQAAGKVAGSGEHATASVPEAAGPRSRAERYVSEDPKLKVGWDKRRAEIQRRLNAGQSPPASMLDPFKGEPWADQVLANRGPAKKPVSESAMSSRRGELENTLRDLVAEDLGPDAMAGLPDGTQIQVARGEIPRRTGVSLERAVAHAEQLPDEHPAKIALHNLQELAKNPPRTKVGKFNTNDVPDGGQVVVNDGEKLTVDHSNGLIRDGVTVPIPEGGVDLYGKKLVPPPSDMPDPAKPAPTFYDADAAGTSGTKPGIFGQPTFDNATGNQTASMFHQPVDVPRPAGDTIKASDAAVDPKNTGEMFGAAGSADEPPKTGKLDQLQAWADARLAEKAAEQAKQVRDAQAAADPKLRRYRGSLGSLDPESVALYAIRGAAHIAKGVVKYAEWAKEMAAEFSELAAHQLPRIWREAKRLHGMNDDDRAAWAADRFGAAPADPAAPTVSDRVAADQARRFADKPEGSAPRPPEAALAKEKAPAAAETAPGAEHAAVVSGEKTAGEKLKDTWHRFADWFNIDGAPKLTRAGVGNEAFAHANHDVHSPLRVADLLARVFGEKAKDADFMKNVMSVMNKDNILGGYDDFQERLRLAKAQNREGAVRDLQGIVEQIEAAHPLLKYQEDVQKARFDDDVFPYVEKWKEHVNPVLDAWYHEAKNLDPGTVPVSRGRYFGARVNLVSAGRSIEPVEDGAAAGDRERKMPTKDQLGGKPANANVKRDPFDRSAVFTGEYITDAQEALQAVVGPRWRELTKKRLYQALIDKGAAVRGGEDVVPPETIQGEPVKPLLVKMAQTNPETGQTRMVDLPMYVRRDLYRELDGVLNLSLRGPDNPFFKLTTLLQTAGISDAVTHIKNTGTTVANAPGTASAVMDVIRKFPVLGTIDAGARILSVAKEIHEDTPEIRREVADIAAWGGIRPSHEQGGLPVLGVVGHVLERQDTATRVLMNRMYSNLVERGLAPDDLVQRRKFVNQAGQYNRRLQGWTMRAFRDAGFAPFVTAGRNYARQGRRYVTGDPGFTPVEGKALQVRATQLAAITSATVLPMILNSLTTGSPLGRPGTPYGAWDLGRKQNDDGTHDTWDFMQLSGLRRGMRSVGADAAINGLMAGQDFNQIAGHAIEDASNSAMHPWIGPGMSLLYSTKTGQRADLRGKMEAQQIPGGGGMQYVENFRAALASQNPLIYSFLRPPFKAAGLDQTPDEKHGYVGNIGQTLLKTPASAMGFKSVYPSRTAAGEMAATLVKQKMGGSGMTPDEARHVEAMKPLQAAVRRGGDEGARALREAVDAGEITDKQAANVARKAGMPELEWAVRSLSADDAMRVYAKATDEEKRQILPALHKKLVAADRGAGPTKTAAARQQVEADAVKLLGDLPARRMRFDSEWSALSAKASGQRKAKELYHTAQELAAAGKPEKAAELQQQARDESLKTRMSGDELRRYNRLRILHESITKVDKRAEAGAVTREGADRQIRGLLNAQ